MIDLRSSVNTKTASGAALRANALNLEALGVRKPADALLVMPRHYIDARKERLLAPSSFDDSEGKAVLALRLAEPVSWTKNGTPRGTVLCQDVRSRPVTLTLFGTAWRWREAPLSPGALVIVEGRTGTWNGRLTVTADTVFPASVAGTFIPVYPTTGDLSSESIRAHIAGLIDDHIDAVADLFESGIHPPLLRALLGRWQRVQDVLRAVHRPMTEADLEAREVMASLDAALLISRARRAASDLPAREPIGIDWEGVDARLRRLPFTLTDAQRSAIEDMLSGLEKNTPMRHMLTGDVGSGKTICYLAAAAAVAQAGRRCAIILPNVVLAGQVHRECLAFFPDLSAALCAGNRTEGDLARAGIVIGTSALLHRKDAMQGIELAIIDEQQRFSTAQREGRIDEDDIESIFPETAHRIEVTATPIPRSLALVSLGVTQVSVLGNGHADKHIHTRIWDAGQRRDLFQHLVERVWLGEKVAIIYPLRESDDDAAPAIRDAVTAFERWNALFPGRARLVHGAQKDAEKKRAIDDLSSGKASILISTTVIEVGVTIPGLTTMAVIDASRYGLSQLHQLRGRLVRHGGTGYFDLFLPSGDRAARERLEILVQTNDGMRIAHHDLCQRGQGVLPGTEQSGKAYGVLLPSKAALTGIDYQVISDVIEKERRVAAAHKVSADAFIPAERKKPGGDLHF